MHIIREMTRQVALGFGSLFIAKARVHAATARAGLTWPHVHRHESPAGPGRAAQGEGGRTEEGGQQR